MKKNSIKISVCIPTYNRFKDLENLIESYIVQDYENSELLILDDLGSEKIGQVVKKWQKKSSKIKYHKNDKNIGFSNNFRQAFKYASGDIISFMGDDDVFIDNHALSYIVEPFENINVGVVKASQIIYKNGRVNQAFPLKADKKEIIYYKKGNETFENLWFESLSITGLAFRNSKDIKNRVSESITLYPQVELMGRVCLLYDSAEINRHIVGVQSHPGQLNCISYDINGVRTNILEDWMHIYTDVAKLAKEDKLEFLDRNRFIDKFSSFILYFFPYNSLTNGRLDTAMFILNLLKYNKGTVVKPLFSTASLLSLILPNTALTFCIEKIKKIRTGKTMDKNQEAHFNSILKQYYN